MKNRQIVKDLGGEHVLKSYGRCVVCNRVTWGYEDEPCPDWRGHTGNATHEKFRAEAYNMKGPDIPICSVCNNTRQTYEIGLARAKLKWMSVSLKS